MEAKNTAPNSESAARELTLTRTLNAPRSLVFKAWTEPKQLAKWWGPNGFTNPVCEVNAVTGGAIRIHMFHPDYPDHWVKGIFKEVVEPNRLVFSNNAHIGENNPPKIESVTTVTFEDDNGKTKMTMRTIVTKIDPDMAAALAGQKEGWNQTLDRLENFLIN